MTPRLANRISRINQWDGELALKFNQACHSRRIRAFFAVVSRLGDGVFWYALMLSLLLANGQAASRPVLHMVAAGLACTLLYKWLKAKTLRPRPYQRNGAIFCGAAPLDQFSFPSGHTLHAVAFSIVASAYFPALAWLLFPFTALVALSRLVLGLHYPSDVLAGALIGAIVATASLPL